jgi:glyoxylase-like metal-dependent hydrolase (beta-lactamase superfamily II)
VRVDLGGRVVNLVPRGGHTASDVTIELEDPRVIFTGDLVFNKMFPFYGDSTPSKWNATNEVLLAEAGALYVPGHGNMARKPEMDTYRELLALVGEAARAGHKAGKTAEQAAAEFKIPDRLGEWFLFNPRVFVFAFDAWYRELNA